MFNRKKIKDLESDLLSKNRIIKVLGMQNSEISTELDIIKERLYSELKNKYDLRRKKK